MKTYVCDICKSEGKLIESKRKISVTGNPNLRLDVCEDCNKNKVPKDNIEYVKLCYKLRGIEISTEQARILWRK